MARKSKFRLARACTGPGMGSPARHLLPQGRVLALHSGRELTVDATPAFGSGQRGVPEFQGGLGFTRHFAWKGREFADRPRHSASRHRQARNG